MKKILPTLLLLTAATLTYGVQNAAEWVKFTSTEGRFSVLLPAQPTEEKDTRQNSKSGPYTTHLFTAKAGGEIYIAGWVDYDPKFNFGVQAELEANRDNFIKAVKAKLLTSAPIAHGSHSGLEFTAERPGIVFTSRVFIIGRRPYQLIAVTPAGRDRSQNVNRFLSSFQVTPAR